MHEDIIYRNDHGGFSETEAVIAFDTSNYTTSVALVDMEGNVIADRRKLLDVKQGERGLRQSEALFQHVVNLPELTQMAMSDAGRVKICCAASSDRPRPVEGSYMPVFRAGILAASQIGTVMKIPVMHFSHQEGHIAAVRKLREKGDRSLTFHMSGGTGEILLTDGNMPVEIVGGTKDISFGQLLDRVGVAAGMGFPAGAELDRMAIIAAEDMTIRYSGTGKTMLDGQRIGNIHTEGTFVNISGTETQITKLIRREGFSEKLAAELFYRISDAIFTIVNTSMDATGTNDMTMAGGVAASSFLRKSLSERFDGTGRTISFGDAELSSDNAVGIGRLAAAQLRLLTSQSSVCLDHISSGPMDNSKR